MHYYRKDVLWAAGKAIGKPIKIDMNIAVADWDRFVKIAIQVDLNEPLLPQLMIEGESIRVEYEGIPEICFGCGKAGHTSRDCKHEVEDRGVPPVNGVYRDMARNEAFTAPCNAEDQIGRGKGAGAGSRFVSLGLVKDILQSEVSQEHHGRDIDAQSTGNTVKKLDGARIALKTWNRRTLGNILHKKRKLNQQIKRVQEALLKVDSSRLWRIERELVVQLRELLDKE
ncbi:hypothetical protein Nepgr_006531 [Nepenthes gracilis]|uniref:CCHC-type domain-containing protein n=1 Tax=Nepenthes gracilis TaxID=150966 RepID=A0AAD3S5E5_NEPGR|nr:hypothetical protein Nepgr_006531 [Nepenthes gracilis]